MLVKKGDKLVVTKKVAAFLDVGDIVEVVDVNDNGVISFAFGEGFVHMGVMNSAECESHFEQLVEKKIAPSVTQEHIDEIIADSDIEIHTVFDKCTIVSCKLPNGFIITESSACVSPENYDEELGINICLEKIENKIWELEGYVLQEKLYRDESGCCCSECDCDECDECDCDEDCEIDDCLDTDLDCDDCNDYECPYNSHRRN